MIHSLLLKLVQTCKDLSALDRQAYNRVQATMVPKNTTNNLKLYTAAQQYNCRRHFRMALCCCHASAQCIDLILFWYNILCLCFFPQGLSPCNESALWELHWKPFTITYPLIPQPSVLPESYYVRGNVPVISPLSHHSIWLLFSSYFLFSGWRWRTQNCWLI